MQEYKFRAEKHDENKRLDIFVHEKTVSENLSRARIQRSIQNGMVKVNNKIQKASYHLKEGDRITVKIIPEEKASLKPQALPLKIIYEDSHIAIINKPAGIAVHPGSGLKNGTLANALFYHFGHLPGSEQMRPGIVHRLDKDTSGLLVIALTEKSQLAMNNLFKNRKIHKEYTAMIYGNMRSSKGIIDKPIGRNPSNRLKMTTNAPRSRECLTEWYTIEEYPGFSLLRVILHTGRTHQIRVHFSSVGHPIVGDTLYGGKRYKSIPDPSIRKSIIEMGRFFLHASKLSFVHPFTGEKITFQAKLPQELEKFIQFLRTYLRQANNKTNRNG